MKGFIVKTVTAVCFAGGGLTAAGCYREIVDPCYPQRYEYAARQDVKASFAPQVHNGHVLDQTVWNYHFEPGTAILNPGGLDHLAYLARRRPCPDPMIYLQVAQDIPYDPAAPDKYVEARNNLDAKRMQAIQDFLTAETAGRPVAFTVVRHDPGDPSISAYPMLNAVRLEQTSAQGVLVRPGGGGGAGGAAPAPR
jgi:hypothetical protein